MQSEHCFIYISTFRMSRGITRGNRISLSTVSWAILGNLFQMSLNIICLSIFVSCLESRATHRTVQRPLFAIHIQTRQGMSKHKYIVHMIFFESLVICCIKVRVVYSVSMLSCLS